MASKTGTRLKKLEQKQGSAEGRLMVMFTDWEPGEEPPDEEIEVSVSYTNGSRKPPEKMSLAEYKNRFPDWEQEEHIVVKWQEGDE